nr:hypothetical protein [Tanacetum cinerariifolium]
RFAVLPPGPGGAGGLRAENRLVCARAPGPAQLLPRSPGPRREKAARKPQHRGAAVPR